MNQHRSESPVAGNYAHGQEKLGIQAIEWALGCVNSGPQPGTEALASYVHVKAKEAETPSLFSVNPLVTASARNGFKFCPCFCPRCKLVSAVREHEAISASAAASSQLNNVDYAEKCIKPGVHWEACRAGHKQGISIYRRYRRLTFRSANSTDAKSSFLCNDL